MHKEDTIMTRIPFTYSLKNIFKTRFLLHIFISCILFSATLTGYSRFYIMPVFSNLLIRNIEKEAERTADYLSASLLILQPSSKPDTEDNRSLTPQNDLKQELFTNDIVDSIKEAQFYLQLEKLKIFDPKGKIVYSTDEKDIGKINTKSYFLEKVVRGEKFSKIVQKNSKSAENRTLKKDVAEIYIPLMNSAKFLGALEIYYDISDRKQALSLLVSRALIAIYSLSIVFLITVGIVLNKASVQILRRRKSDEQLLESNKMLEFRVAVQTEEISQTQKISVKALATLAEYYDSDTGEHLIRIQSYIEILARWLLKNSPYSTYLSEKKSYIEDLKLACLLHDVGKTAIPVEILTKPGKLTFEEFKIIKTHTTIAGQALTIANNDFRLIYNINSYLALARNIALYHHEKWNGKGYPEGLAGELIPLSARIVAVADVYDALRTKRPYKAPWSHLKALNEIFNEKGEHFDPIIVDAFISNSDHFKAISDNHNSEQTFSTDKSTTKKSPEL